MQKVIGLDIGSYSIKAVEIVNTFKSYEISDFYEKVIPYNPELASDLAIPAAMEQLFAENNLKADRIITAMPGQYVSSRILPFNFADPRKIEIAISAEIEDKVPFNLDEMIIDHQILGTMKGKTIALIVMTRKSFLKSFLDHLLRINIDPKLIDVDSLAFYNLYPFLNIEAGSCTAMVDIGHEKTSVCIVRDGLLRSFRSINLGGKYLTEFLARDLEVSFPEAEAVKHRVSRVFCENDDRSFLTGDDLIIAERLSLAANALVKELGRTLYSFKTWEKEPISKIILSGGTSRIQNFQRYLQDQLDIPVVANDLSQGSLKISQNLDNVMAILPQSAAIGIRAVSSVKKHSQINLRSGEFANVQNYEEVMKATAIAFKTIAIALALLIMTYSVQYYYYKKQIDSLQQNYRTEFLKIFPEFKKKYSSQTVQFSKMRNDAKSQLNQEIESLRKATDEFNEKNSGSAALLALQAVSQAIPKELKVDITQFQFTLKDDAGGKIILKGETDAYATAAKIVEAVKGSQDLSEVEEKGTAAKPGTDNKVLEFTINANFKNKAGTKKEGV